MGYDMATSETTAVMSEEGRALLTEREREILRGDAEVTDNYVYKVKSLVRTRIRRHLADDIEVLEENFPEAHLLVLESIREADDAE